MYARTNFAFFEKLRLIQLRRVAGSKKAQETKNRKQLEARERQSGGEGVMQEQIHAVQRQRRADEHVDPSPEESASESNTSELDESDDEGEDKEFHDSDLVVGDRITVAWPDGTIFSGFIKGRPSKYDALHCLESEDGEPGLPVVRSCARVVLFDDNDTLRLGLPK